MTIRSHAPSAQSARAHGNKVVRSRSFEALARAGFAARGLIYGIVGVLALKLALGDGGRTTDQQGALRTIARQPFGHALLIAVAIGLAGYAIWRLVRAAMGHGPEASDDTLDRVAGVASGLIYAGLCVAAVGILTQSGGGSGSAQKTTGGVLGWPEGRWIVGIAGVVMIGVGAYQGYRGVAKKFLEDSKTEQMSRRGRDAFTAIGMAGHLARMVVFALVGVFLVKAAIDFSPSQAVGLDGALNKLVHQAYGPVLLGIVAAGLIAFALYSLADARYRKV